MSARRNKTPTLWDTIATACRSTLELGSSGNMRLERRTVSKEDEDFNRIRALFSGVGRFTPAGTYTGLLEGKSLWMSDAPDEIRDFLPFGVAANGNVLVTGLGLGCTVDGLFANPAVQTVTVQEINQDVIDLVGEQMLRKHGISRLTIVRADAYQYKPSRGERYDCAWHDIWPEICTDNLPEMDKLKRKWARRIPHQEFWCRRLLLRLREQGW